MQSRRKDQREKEHVQLAGDAAGEERRRGEQHRVEDVEGGAKTLPELRVRKQKQGHHGRKDHRDDQVERHVGDGRLVGDGVHKEERSPQEPEAKER